MSPRHCSTVPPYARIGRGVARLTLTVAMTVSLSGCSGFFESLASFFGGEVEQTGPVMARNTEAPLAVPQPVQEQFCYREAQYLDMGPEECLHYGGRPVIVRGGLEALRNRTLGRPDAAPVPEVETVGTVAPNGRVAEAGSSQGRIVDRGWNGGQWNARSASPDVSGVRPTAAELRPAPLPRGNDTGRLGQCYREYRYLNLSPDDCRRHGGVVVDDSFSPGPQPLHKVQPIAGPREEAASRPVEPADGKAAERQGDEQRGDEMAAAKLDQPAVATVVRVRDLDIQRVATGPVNASYTLHKDVWRCRLGKQLLRLEMDACAAARGNMVRGDVLEDMHGIAKPANEDRTSHIVLTPSVQMARAAEPEIDRIAAPDRTGNTGRTEVGAAADRPQVTAEKAPGREPAPSIFAEPEERVANRPGPGTTSQTEVDPIYSVANGPKSGLPAPATLPADGPSYRPEGDSEDEIAIVAPGNDAVAETVRVDGSDPLWPGSDMRLANRREVDKWDAVVPVMASDHAGQRRLFCYREGQYLTLSSDDCDAAGGILTVGQPDPFTGPIAPAPGPVVESGPLVTPARLSRLVAQRD